MAINFINAYQASGITHLGGGSEECWNEVFTADSDEEAKQYIEQRNRESSTSTRRWIKNANGKDECIDVPEYETGTSYVGYVNLGGTNQNDFIGTWCYKSNDTDDKSGHWE